MADTLRRQRRRGIRRSVPCIRRSRFRKLRDPGQFWIREQLGPAVLLAEGAACEELSISHGTALHPCGSRQLKDLERRVLAIKMLRGARCGLLLEGRRNRCQSRQQAHHVQSLADKRRGFADHERAFNRLQLLIEHDQNADSHRADVNRFAEVEPDAVVALAHDLFERL